MGIYAKMAEKFASKYAEIEDSVLSIKDTVTNLDEKIRSIDFFDFQASEKLEELKQLQDIFETLRAQVDEINEEIEQMEKDDTQLMNDSEKLMFDSLNKQAGQINKTIQITDKKLIDIQKDLTTNNVWAAVIDIIDHVRNEAKKIVIKVIKVSIKGVKEAVKFLPPEVQELGRALVSNVVRDTRRLLEGR